MRALVIGGTRFVGYHIVRKLLDENVEVTLFNRGQTADDFGNRVQRIHGDRKDYKKFYETFRRSRFDVVIDVIGYDPEDVEIAIKTFKGRIGQYIFISTGQVYLVTRNTHWPAREEDYYQPLAECPPGEEAGYEYGVKKRACEDLLEEAYKFQKFPSVRFRFPIIHGPRDYSLRLYSYIRRILDGNPLIIPEDGDVIVRHVYVGDVVRAIFRVLQVESTRGKVYNVASKEVMRLSEFIRLTARMLERDVEIVPIPEKVMLEHHVTRDVSPFSGKWVSYLDPSLIMEELKFQPTPVEEWLRETVRYFIDEYSGPDPDNYRQRPRELELIRYWKQFKKMI